MTRRSPTATLLVVAGVTLATGALAAAVGLAIGGAGDPVLRDPGVLVRWGLPLAEVAARLAATVTIGGLAVAVVVLPPADSGPAVRAATAAAVVWAAAQAACLVLTAVNVVGSPVADDGAPALVAFLGTAAPLLWAAWLAGAVAGVLLTVSGPGRTLVALGGALLALVPVAAAGHTADHGPGHGAASAVWLHLGAAAIWAGGLLVLVVLFSGPRAGLADRASSIASVRRFSRVAGWCYAVVAASGVLAVLGMSVSPAELLTTGWGALLVAKAALLGVLGVAGWAHRRVVIGRAALSGERPLARLALGEVVVLAAAVGLGVALGSSAPPPSSSDDVTLPPLTAAAVLTRWSPEPVPALLAIAGLVTYLRWVARLVRRGDRWPAGRVLAWAGAMLLLLWVTGGGPAAYGHVLISAHMVQHMVLVTAVPVLAALASPVTLALRALPRAADGPDGPRGPREWLLALLGSRAARILLHPVVATANVVVSMAVFYATPLFERSLTNGVVHLAVVLHFSVAGYAFTTILVGTDPVPHRPPYPLRLLMLAPAMVFHTVLGLVLVTSSQVLLAAPVLAEVRPEWLTDPVTDQQAAGALVWALGEIPALGLALLVAARWAAADVREQRRAARRAAA